MDTTQVITLVATIIAALVGLYGVLFGPKALTAWLRERLGLSDPFQSTIVDADRNRRNKDILRNMVRIRWVDDVLTPSIQPTGLLALDMKYKPGAVEGPWEQPGRHVRRAERTRDSFHKAILQVFDGANGRLLILGDPGSGKTIALLELARCLLVRTQRDSLEPIPVVFNLASWVEARKPIERWLMDELSVQYQIPREIGGAWIRKGELQLLLDGLDEVKPEYQRDCVNAINKFVKAHEETRLAICCRSADYERIHIRLKLQDAVILQPLTSARVKRSVARMRAVYPDLQKLFQKDPAWQGFANSPLLLNSLVNVFKKTSFDSLPKFKSRKDRGRYLLQAYVDNMFEQDGSKKQPFPRDRTLQWLSWLAGKMKEHGQEVFLIEKIQPDWLPKDRHALYGIGIRLIVGLVVGVSFGLATGVASGLVFGSQFGVISSITFGITWALIGWLAFERTCILRDTLMVAAAAGLAFGVAGWMALGTLGAVIFSLLGLLAGGLGFGLGCRQMQKVNSLGTPENVVLIEALNWSWTKATRSMLLWVPLGLVVGLVIGAPVWRAAGPLAGVIYGIATALVYVISFGAAGGLTSGEIETKTAPNQGIWRSRHNGGLIGGAFGCLVALIFSLSFGIPFGASRGLLAGLTSGLAAATVGWFLFGGLTYVQHYWLRTLLMLKTCMPWNYAEFLDYASERILLRKVGGGYMFIHRLLLDYFGPG